MKLFYHPDLWSPLYAFESTRKPLWMYQSLRESPIENVSLTLCSPIERAELEALHDEVYLNAVQTGAPLSLAQSQGFDWDPNIFRMGLAACGSLKDAVIDALQSGVSGTLGGGFHHAKRHRGQGCCTFQGTILAAREAQRRGAARILIIDLDAHCAGGTHSYLQGDDSIWQLDLATSPVDGYKPTGHNSLDLIRGADNYLSTLTTRLAALHHQKKLFSLCIYKAGMDPYEGCDTGGLRGITAELLKQRDELVFSWCRANQIPVAFLLAGGYLGPTLSRDELVSLHRTTITSAAQ